MMGIESIADLKAADPALIRKKFSVVLQRTVMELNGTECIPHTEEHVDKQQIMFSRSFSTPVTTVAGMEEVMAVYAQRGAARLNEEGLRASTMTVTAGTSRFAGGEGSFPAVTIRFMTPTQDPIVLVRAAVAAIGQSAVPGAAYLRAGVMFNGLEPASGTGMLDVFGTAAEQAGCGRMCWARCAASLAAWPSAWAWAAWPRPRMVHEARAFLAPLHHGVEGTARGAGLDGPHQQPPLDSSPWHYSKPPSPGALRCSSPPPTWLSWGWRCTSWCPGTSPP